MSSLITAQGLCVHRSGNAILNDVSVDIAPGDFITIVGPNGAGKSMLLKCMMGFYTPDQGSITRSKSLNVGYVPQRLAPEPTMPIKARRFLTLRQQVTSDELETIADMTSITPFLDKPLYVLSGGELQRVLLARALLKQPNLLVLDEPAQNLDVSGQLAFYKLLDEIYREKQIAILMVSHDLHLVMASTKKVLCLYHHICCSGSPQVVTRDPEFIKLFGNDMARMMAVYHHHHDHQHGADCDHSHDHHGDADHG